MLPITGKKIAHHEEQLHGYEGRNQQTRCGNGIFVDRLSQESRATSNTGNGIYISSRSLRVTLTRSKTEYSYLHPQKQKAIRRKKLGNNYTKEIILDVITANSHTDSRTRETLERISEYNGQSTAEKSNKLMKEQNTLIERT